MKSVTCLLILVAVMLGGMAGATTTRHVFINNNSNGTPTEDGHAWQLRLDLLHPVAHVGASPVNLGLGVRKAFFTGTFDFVGGNENFDVTGRPWGVGLVLDTAFAVGDRVDFTVMAGVDYYFDATLEGHDTSTGTTPTRPSTSPASRSSGWSGCAGD